MSRRSRLARLVLAAVLATAASVAPTARLSAGPPSQPWIYWQANDPSARAGIDHATWSELLARYRVEGEDGVARFAYARVSGADRTALASYIETLAATPITRFHAAEQFAYWVNLYNALTIQVVLDHFPVASIRDIDLSPGLFARGPWQAKLLTIEGQPVSLDDIEHRILRPIWRDPRIHYAVSCASIGCPNLAAEAFTAGNSERLLDAGAQAFVNHPRGARVDDGRLAVSSIYVWFKDDFGGDDAGVIAHLRRYAHPPLAERLQTITAVDDASYDWSLNAAP